MVRVRAAALAETLETRQLLTATILGRYTFYGDSAFDTSTTSVQAAIAPDKTALLPGQTATFANYTSYVKGVNGIAIDATNWPAAPVASDFILKAGNNAIPATWSTITQTATFSIERGAGTGGSDRIVIRLPDNTYRNEWVQVTVNPTTDTGLSSPDVFYFGNAVGDDGHGLTNAIVDSSNESSARLDAHGFTNTAPITDLYDFNRDGVVNLTDQLIARQSVDTTATALQYFTAPTPADPGTTGSFSAVFNVKNYGATGNGTTDDTAGLQAAINALSTAGQGLLYFPSGAYRIDTSLNLQNLSNFEIRGTGATLMALSSEESADSNGDLLRVDGCSNFTLSGLTFDADSAQRTQTENPSSLWLQGDFNFRVTNCAFNNTVGDAIDLCALSASIDATADHDGLIEGCSINSAWRNGISLVHGSRINIESNLFQNISGTAPQAGIDIEANSNDTDGANRDITIDNNRFQNIAETGVAVPSSMAPYDVTIDSNQFSNVPTGVFNQGLDTVVDNNVFGNYTNTPSPTSVAMIYCPPYAGGQHVEIGGNSFNDLSGVGAIMIDPQWIGSALVSNNRISNLSGSGFDAINLNDNNTVVTANIITNCSGLPIGIDGSDEDVENNNLNGGTGDGIAVTGSAMIVRGNTVSNFAVGLDLRDNASTGPTATASIVSGNTISGCPTGLFSSLIHSQVTGNSFSNATKPASGPGSNATGEILLLSVSGGTALIANNTLTNISGVIGLDIVGNWIGQATITSNQFTTIGGTAITTGAPSVITGNTITNAAGGGLGIYANNCDVENNVIAGGNGIGVYCAADGLIFKDNTVSGQDIALWFSEPTGGPIAGLYTVIDSNTFTGCYTGIYGGTTYSTITNNGFFSVTRPASGTGSDAVAQIYLISGSNGVTTISGNTFNNVNGISPITIAGNWSGVATISSNKITNLQGPVSAISVSSSNAVITNNTLQNDSGGIAVEGGTNVQVENNTLTSGASGIFCQGTNCFITNNVLTDAGDPNVGDCIFTAWGTATTISGNTISKTVPDAAWIPIVSNVTDILGVNYGYGVDGLDGAFGPASNASPPPNTATSGTPSTTSPPAVVTTPVPTRPRRVSFVVTATGALRT